MKKILMSKPALTLASVATTAVALAEGEAGSGGVQAELVTSYITTGQAELVKVLTAGAAIIGAFFVWALIRKALNRSK